MPTAVPSKNQYLLNSTSLQGFYDQLEENDVKYLVLAKQDILRSRHLIPDAIWFAINNFPIAYEDINYMVLNVPNLSHSDPQANTALVYQKNPLFLSPLVNNGTTTLYFNESSFQFPESGDAAKGPTPEQVVLNGSMNGDATLWSKDIQDRQTNFIQVSFQVLNGTEDCGVVWKESDKKGYYLRLGFDNLELSEITKGDTSAIIRSSNSEPWKR